MLCDKLCGRTAQAKAAFGNVQAGKGCSDRVVTNLFLGPALRGNFCRGSVSAAILCKHGHWRLQSGGAADLVS